MNVVRFFDILAEPLRVDATVTTIRKMDDGTGAGKLICVCIISQP